MESLSTETSTQSGAPLSILPESFQQDVMQNCNFWTNKAKVIKYGVIFASENPLKVELMFVQSLKLSSL
jgi:hypothetical protein